MLAALEGERFLNNKFESAIRTVAGIKGDDKKLTVISSAYSRKEYLQGLRLSFSHLLRQ
jgi:hypothetical protein